jgi:hypothetical protein
MKFFQHVYGRVSKGYRRGLQGYQLAALTDELAERLELVERLNRFSFFNLRNGTGAEERFSFYRPVAGFLAFGCSRLARDRSGSTGWFAHHYVCDEESFLNSSISPPRVLQQLTWLKNEIELPANRSLQAIEFPSNEQHGVAAGEMTLASATIRPFALQILDMLMGKPLPVVPLVVATDEETWPILSELFSLAPRLEAASLSFSTLFADATDFIEAFRLVFVPDEKHVPSGTYVYRVAKAGTTFNPPPPPLLFTSIWRKHETKAPTLVRFINCMRQPKPELDEAAALLQELLAIGKDFRDCVESLRLQIYDVVLRDEKWIVAYARAGSSIHYREISTSLWKDPEKNLVPLLKASAELAVPELAEQALEDLAIKLAAGHVDTSIFTELHKANCLQMFYQVTTRSLSPVALIELIDRIKNQHFYDNELHRILGHLSLVRILSDDRDKWIDQLRWLHDEHDVRTADSFVDAVVGVGVWVNNKRSNQFWLRAYELSSSDYLILLENIWTHEFNRWQTYQLFEIVFHPRYVGELLWFVSQQLKHYDKGLQIDVLNVFAQKFGLAAVRNQSLLEAIRLSNDSRDVAKSFRRQLLKSHPTINEGELGELTRLERQGRRRFLNL